MHYNPPSHSQETSYIYAPGLFGSPIIIGRYISSFVADTGETITGTRGGNIFGDGTKITAVTFPEISTTQPQGWLRSWLGSHVARTIFQGYFGIQVEENGNSSTTIFNYIFDLTRINIGQQDDIDALKKCFEIHKKRFPETQILLFGDSRGAVTAFNFIAQEKPPLTAAVLEAPFDSMSHLLKHCFRWNKKGALVEKGLKKLIAALSKKYSFEGPCPLDYTAQMPEDMPLLFVTSLADRIVPYQSTMTLYCALQEHVCTHVHLLVLKKSAHDSYMLGPEKRIYESVVHRFYAQYGLAHDRTKALQGAEAFAITQPSAEQVRTTYHLTQKCCRAYKRESDSGEKKFGKSDCF